MISKKKNIALFLFSLLMVISLTGCSDDSTGNENQNLTGDYWPTSVNNAWVYTGGTDEISIKIIGTEDVNGSKYYGFNQLDIFGGATEVAVHNGQSFSIKKNKGDYYIKVDEKNTTIDGVSSKITGYEFLFFKDYLDVNQTWTGTYNYIKSNKASFLPIQLTEGTYTGEILEKGISLTVNGTVFKNVIKFRFTQSIDDVTLNVWPAWDYSSDYWIAKDVGIIKFSSNTYNGKISEHKSHKVK
ncbi:hypothetical protein [Flavobacterium chungangense]|uniref:hypothetical protein n=1 Tax=Flavobacterium chungangense TaxID=554283 RepID=UPI0004DF01ED|nr:hypothetical protein [Flavobacterium chungangense]